MPFACLMYHSLSDGRRPDTMYPKYTTTLATFREHLAALTGEGYTLDSFGGLLARINAGTPLPERYCLLTFDDGHASSLDMADAMSDAGANGTFFLTRDYCRDRADFLKEPDIRAMAARGFHFGTHGCTHRALGHLPEPAMREELAGSKKWLEDILGTAIETMSLPAGQGSAGVRKAAWSMGYRLMGNSREGLNRAAATPAEIRRFVVMAPHTSRDAVYLASGPAAYVWKRRLRAAALWLPKRVLRTYNATRT